MIAADPMREDEVTSPERPRVGRCRVAMLWCWLGASAALAVGVGINAFWLGAFDPLLGSPGFVCMLGLFLGSPAALVWAAGFMLDQVLPELMPRRAIARHAVRWYAAAAGVGVVFAPGLLLANWIVSRVGEAPGYTDFHRVVVFGGSLVLIAWIVGWAVRRTLVGLSALQFVSDTVCHECGYDLRGGFAARCPECGMSVNASNSA